jgi:hypothetical protein
MKQLIKSTAIILTILLSGLTAKAGDLLAPGSYLNPWVITPDNRGGATIQPKMYTGQDILAPGSFYNPLVVEKKGRNLEVRPKYPWSDDKKGEDNGDTD